MNFINLLKQFIAQRAGKISLILAFLSLALLPIFLSKWPGPFAERRFFEVYDVKLREPLALIREWVKADVSYFQLDYMGIVYMFLWQLDIDALMIFFALMGCTFLLSFIAFASKYGRVSALIGGVLSTATLIAYFSLNISTSYYASLQQKQKVFEPLLTKIKNKENFSKFDRWYEFDSVKAGDIYYTEIIGRQQNFI